MNIFKIQGQVKSSAFWITLAIFFYFLDMYETKTNVDVSNDKPKEDEEHVTCICLSISFSTI